jgi:hypothetical protein
MRPSLSSLSALLALAALLVFSTGCVQRTHRASGNRVALALTVNGTEQPNAEQWANVVAALKPELTAQGLVLVNDLADADRILRIDFTPSFTAPNSAGHAMFLGWRINPLRAPAFASASRTSLSYVNYSSGLSAYHNSPYGYDRYSDYGYGYSGGGSTASVTPPTAPPSTPPHPPLSYLFERLLLVFVVRRIVIVLLVLRFFVILLVIELFQFRQQLGRQRWLELIVQLLSGLFWHPRYDDAEAKLSGRPASLVPGSIP